MIAILGPAWHSETKQRWLKHLPHDSTHLGRPIWTRWRHNNQPAMEDSERLGVQSREKRKQKKGETRKLMPGQYESLMLERRRKLAAFCVVCLFVSLLFSGVHIGRISSKKGNRLAEHTGRKGRQAGGRKQIW